MGYTYADSTGNWSAPEGGTTIPIVTFTYHGTGVGVGDGAAVPNPDGPSTIAAASTDRYYNATEGGFTPKAGDLLIGRFDRLYIGLLTGNRQDVHLDLGDGYKDLSVPSIGIGSNSTTSTGPLSMNGGAATVLIAYDGASYQLVL